MAEIKIEDFVNLAMRQQPDAFLRVVAPLFTQIRGLQLSKIPKVSLLPRNAANCSVLIDRQELVERIPPNAVCVEIGVDEGFFSQRILRFAQPQKLYLVDMWGTNRFGEDKYLSVSEKFKSEVGVGKVEIIRTNSIDAANRFEDASLDWIYIDTDHSYATTKSELYAYANKLKPGGLIAGHDYCMGNWVNGYKYGVIEAVHEFCVAEDWEFLYITIDFTESQSFAIRKIPSL